MALRIIQWGIGNIGKEALRSVVSDPGFELVGAWKYHDQGTDVDVGELFGLPATGVKATVSAENLVATEADCVLYMPCIASLDDVCALLASGKNVVSIPFLFYAPALPAADRLRVEEACQRGNSTLYGTGINPGFVGMIQPIVLSGMSQAIRRVSVFERANWTHYNNPRITFDCMRFGAPRERALLAENPYAQFVDQLFKEQIVMLADAWNLKLDDLIVEQDLVVADEVFDIVCGRIERGTVCGQRFHWQGISQSDIAIEIDALWNVGKRYPAHWPTPQDGWSVAIEGSPSLYTHFICCASLDPGSSASFDDHAHAAEIATAMQAVNSVEAVCAAPPGIVAAYGLPLARPYLPFSRRR